MAHVPKLRGRDQWLRIPSAPWDKTHISKYHAISFLLAAPHHRDIGTTERGEIVSNKSIMDTVQQPSTSCNYRLYNLTAVCGKVVNSHIDTELGSDYDCNLILKNNYMLSRLRLWYSIRKNVYNTWLLCEHAQSPPLPLIPPAEPPRVVVVVVLVIVVDPPAPSRRTSVVFVVDDEYDLPGLMVIMNNGDNVTYWLMIFSDKQ